MAALRFPVDHFGGGVNEGQSIFKLPPDTASVISNVDYPRWPAMSVRAGSSKLTATQMSAHAVTGLYDVGLSSGTRVILAKCNTVLYKYNTSTGVFDSVDTGLTAGNARFATYKDTILRFGPEAPEKSTNGSTWAALGGTPPTAKYVTVHGDRVFAANASGYESILYFSALENAEDWTTITGSGAAGSIPVDTNDGTVITGLWELPGWGRLLVGKERALYFLRGTGPASFTADFVTRKSGPVAQEAGVVTPTGEFYFAAHDGIYLFDGWSPPRQIQGPVQTTWDTRNKSCLSRIATGYTNEGGVERILFAIPTGSAVSPDKVLVYYPNIKVAEAATGRARGIWSIWSGVTPYLFAPVQVSGVDYLMWGDSAGYVWKALQGTRDGTTDIAWSRESGAYDFATSEQKYLARLSVQARAESSGSVSVAYSTSHTGDYLTASTVALATETPVKRSPCPFAAGESVGSNVFRWRVAGTAGPATVERMEVEYRRGGY
jgi:hypothetical protein